MALRLVGRPFLFINPGLEGRMACVWLKRAPSCQRLEFEVLGRSTHHGSRSGGSVELTALEILGGPEGTRDQWGAEVSFPR